MHKNIWGIHIDRSVGLTPIEQNYIGIGWSELGDLSKLPPNRDSFKAALKENQPNATDASVRAQSSPLFRFTHEMQIGDYVIYPSKTDRMIYVGIIKGNYEYQSNLEDDEYKFYPGVSYRHLTIWDHGEVVELVPPHDVLGQKIGQYLPKQEKLKEMMEKSFDILNHHPINEARAEKGLNKANSIWFWGAGTKPALDDFKEKTGMNGAMVSAVDLLKGIAVGANMRNLDVEGANGGLDTNYHGKAMAAVEALLEKNDDFAYIHVEAPDEMGHQGSLENKIKAIEHLDKEVVKVVKEELEKAGEDFRILIGPDHPTPIAIRTHSKEPIPFMIYDSTKDYEGQEEYSEEAARETGIVISHAYDLMNRLLQK